MLLKLLVFIEWALFAITILLLTILAVLASKMKKNQFTRLFSFPGSKRKSLNEIRERLIKAGAALPVVRANVVMSTIILIISLSGIWFLIYKKIINVPIAAEVTLLGIFAIAPLPVVVALLEYCVNKMLKRADELTVEGE